MGNRKSQVVDMSTNGNVPQYHCCICFDQYSGGLMCESEHMICQSCVAPYIKTISEDAGKLKDRQYVISCPVPLCKARPYTTLELLDQCGDSEALNKYVTKLVEVCKQKEVSAFREPATKPEVVPLLLDALNLKCSNKQCGAVLDPTPDGCAAVRCSNCATYVCFLCFATSPNNSLCHKHVRECEYSPNPSDLFINQALREPAHKRVRVIQLRQVLANTDRTQGLPYDRKGNAESNELGRQLRSIPEARRYLKSISSNLAEVGITISDIFNLDVSPKATAGRSPPKQPQAPAGTARRIVHGQGPLLQPAIGRYVPWWEMGLIVLVSGLFLLIMVYLIFLLASVADLRKEGATSPASGGTWEAEEGATTGTSSLVEQLTEGVFVDDSVRGGGDERALWPWAQVVYLAFVLGSLGLFYVGGALSLGLWVYRR